MPSPSELNPAQGSQHASHPARDRSGAQDGVLPDWPPGVRMAFRFVFLFTLLFSLTFFGQIVVAALPFGTRISLPWLAATQATWIPVVRWVALNVLHIAPGVGGMPTAQLNQLISLLCISVLAGVSSAIWGYVDRGRRAYRVLHEWLRVYLRFSVGLVLLEYGVLKVLLNQFGYPPSPSALMTPVGDLSRMGMLAVFTSTSAFYQAFAGAVELLAGVLLMLRRTATVGALLGLGAMTNVVVLNLGYFGGIVLVLGASTLFMCVILIIPVMPRLIAAVASSRAIPAAIDAPLFATRRATRLAGVLAPVVMLSALASLLHDNLTDGMHSRGRPPLYGAYEVESIVRHPLTSQARVGDLSDWRWLTIDPKASFNRMPGNAVGTIHTASGSEVSAMDVDTSGKKVRLRPPGAKDASQWTYSVPDSSRLVLAGAGVDGSDTLVITLRRRGPGTFALLAREAWRPDFWLK